MEQKRSQKLSDWKKGLFKKCLELGIICGAKVFLRIESQAGKTYTFTNEEDMWKEYKTTGLKPKFREHKIEYNEDGRVA